MIASAADAQAATAADTEAAATDTEAAAATHTEAAAAETAGAPPEIDAASNRSADRRKLRRPTLHTIVDIKAQRRFQSSTVSSTLRRAPQTRRSTTSRTILRRPTASI